MILAAKGRSQHSAVSTQLFSEIPIQAAMLSSLRGSQMEGFWHDVLHAARALIKHQGYSAFAILTLGLGIGVNVGMFSVFGWLLSPKLSVPRSFELVEIDRQPTSMQPSG